MVVSAPGCSSGFHHRYGERADHFREGWIPTDVASVVAPLTDLLKPKVRFVWSEGAQGAFENASPLLLSSCPGSTQAWPALHTPGGWVRVRVDAHGGSGAPLVV